MSIVVHAITQDGWDRSDLASALANLLDACIAEPWEKNTEAEVWADELPKLAATLGFKMEFDNEDDNVIFVIDERTRQTDDEAEAIVDVVAEEVDA